MSSHLQTHLITSTFNVLCRFSGIKKTAKAGSFKCPCLLFASRYSFAKRTRIEAVFTSKSNNFFLYTKSHNHWFVQNKFCHL
ncbi:hypothetical protein DMZ49_23560 [Shigella flexneri]|nr:hypothetical protein [Shigella flexneri]EFX1267008.1 hypothetical protein [Shigella flexneri]EGE1219694.1 hypothetical protein [Shigella flexneri]EGO8347339.1 hypothetical protein [Shigella flexneri]